MEKFAFESALRKRPAPEEDSYGADFVLKPLTQDVSLYIESSSAYMTPHLGAPSIEQFLSRLS